MKVFNLYFKILKAKKASILSYLLLFLLVFTLISANVKSSLAEQEVRNYAPDLSIFDHDETPLTQSLSKYLFAQCKKVDLEREDEEIIHDALYSQITDYVLIIPEGFTQRLDTERDTLMVKTYVSSYQPVANNVDLMIESYIHNWDLIRWTFGGDPQGDDLQLALSRLENVMMNKIHTSVLGEESDAIFGLRSYLSYLTYIITAIAFFIIGLPIVIVEAPLMKRRDVASGFDEMRRTQQLFLASYLSMTIVWFVMVMYSIGNLGFQYLSGRTVQLMVLSSFIHMLAISSLVLFLCHIFPRSESISFLSTLLSLLLAFSSGTFVPKELLWQPFHKFSSLFPTYWEIKNQTDVQGLLVAGHSLQPYLVGLLIMLGMGVLFFVLTLIQRRFSAGNLKEASIN